ncbi:hypothetical protein E4T42_07114 [Aureobasidium subglaciale]|nr:hypothetical protein E4T42_07114 [Aureobasidium subglaciale]
MAFPCTRCPLAVDYLSEHLKVHELPYRCSTCAQAHFYTPARLRGHHASLHQGRAISLAEERTARAINAALGVERGGGGCVAPPGTFSHFAAGAGAGAGAAPPPAAAAPGPFLLPNPVAPLAGPVAVVPPLPPSPPPPVAAPGPVVRVPMWTWGLDGEREEIPGYFVDA